MRTRNFQGSNYCWGYPEMRSTLDLISTPPVSPYPEDPTSGDDEWAGAHFFGCCDPETFMRFLEASNYCFGYSDSDNGNYDPS